MTYIENEIREYKKKLCKKMDWAKARVEGKMYWNSKDYEYIEEAIKWNGGTIFDVGLRYMSINHYKICTN